MFKTQSIFLPTLLKVLLIKQTNQVDILTNDLFPLSPGRQRPADQAGPGVPRLGRRGQGLPPAAARPLVHAGRAHQAAQAVPARRGAVRGRRLV